MLILQQVLQTEQDLSTKRNAFQMLCNHAQPLAVNYLLSQVWIVSLSQSPCTVSR
jgi:hypothetical protein